MGSKSSSSTERVAGWVNTGYCSCSQDYFNVTKVRWKSVPMAGQAWATTGRIASLGIAEFWHKGSQYSHDVIQLWLSCTNCRRDMQVTMEFSDSGKQLNWGRYELIKQGSGSVVECSVNYKFSKARHEYNRMPNSGYNLASYNCKHWAKSLWNDL